MPSARRSEVMFDGGIRSGQDVMRALALGAKSCMIGRAYVYGLGAGGQAGVAKAIDIIAQRTQRHHGAVRRQQDRRDRAAVIVGGMNTRKARGWAVENPPELCHEFV